MKYSAGLRIVLLAAALGLLAYAAPNNYTMGDSRGALLTSQSILEGHRGRLDPYPSVVESMGYRATRDGEVSRYLFPVGSSLVALPAVAVGRLFAADMTNNGTDTLYQMLLGSAILAFLVVLFWIPLRSLGWRGALAAAVIVAASPAMSTMGTAYWNMGPAIVCVVAAALCAVAAHDRSSRVATAAVPVLLALAWLCRPTMALPALLVVALMIASGRVPRATLLTATVVGGLLALGSQWVFQGAFFPAYYNAGRVAGSPDLVALAGHLFSPSRGLLLFSPLVLGFGVVIASAARTRRNLAIVAGGVLWFAGHWIAVSRFEHWWGGHSFGPRLMTEAYFALALTACLIEPERRRARLRRPVALLFAVLASVSIWIHIGQGLFEPGSAVWNSRPVSVDADPSRVWSLSDWQITADRGQMLDEWYRERQANLEPVTLMERVDAGSASVALDGFLWPYRHGESAFAMTVRSHSSLEYRLPTADSLLVANLELGAHREQHLTILDNGEELISLELRGFNPQTVSIPLPPGPGTTDRRRLDFISTPLYEVDPLLPSWRDPRLGISFWALTITQAGGS